MTVLWRLIEKIALKFGFEKGLFLTKFHFYIKRSMEISGKGLLQFDQETSSLIGNQTYHRTKMFSPYQPNSCYESDYECICIMINGNKFSVPLKYFEQCTFLGLLCKSFLPFVNTCEVT